ncbi:MAG: SurA N-terminal domain-containing protein, partial [Deltaproteobacteria bacterium]|nr:SurA N-terminal domain-containing protein [Deltaproteobacteria bacterium]
MLDILRSKTNTIAVYVILGLIILTFAVGFGPASNKVEGCSGKSNVLATLDGKEIKLEDWFYSMHFIGLFTGNNDFHAMKVRRMAMDKLLERKILRSLAHKNGIRFTRKDAEDMILSNRVIIFGMEMQLSHPALGGWPTHPQTGKPLDFNYTLFKRFVRSIRNYNDENQFLDQQVAEMEAKAYKDAFIFGQGNSSKEQWINYQNDYLGLTFKTAVFTPDDFIDKVEIKDAEVEKYLESKEGKEQAEKEFEANKDNYLNAPVERRVRVLKVSINVDGFFDDIKAVEKKDLASLRTAVPKHYQLYTWLEELSKKLTLENMAQAPVDMGKDKAVFKDFKWVEKEDEMINQDLLVKIFDVTPGKEIHGPYFINKNVYFFNAHKQRGGKAKKEKAVKRAARALLTSAKSVELCKKKAESVLEKLKKSKSPESIKELPEMLTEGPVNPISPDEQTISKDIASQLWKLKKAGKVLPKVVKSPGKGIPLFKIYLLESRSLPSRQDFQNLQEEKNNSSITMKAFYALDNTLKEICRNFVERGKLKIKSTLQQELNYKIP